VSDAKKEEKKEEPKPAGKAKGKILAVLGLLVVVGVSSVAGAALSPIIGPRVSGAPAPPKPVKPHAPPKDEADQAEDEEEEVESDKGKKESHGLMTLEAAVVDLRDATGETHHLKIAIAIEERAEVPEEEAKVFLMRAKDAEITYLRTLSYEDVTDHAKFEQIRKELSTRVLKAFGKKHGKKMLITEYVVQ
jgi:flagellar basal body-associated protein FliL